MKDNNMTFISPQGLLFGPRIYSAQFPTSQYIQIKFGEVDANDNR